MDREKCQELAQYLLKAQDEKYEVEKITATIYPELSMAEAYEVQKALVEMRLARGEKIIGPKMGLTSLAKLKQMNVTDPIYGFVFDTMIVEDGHKISLTDYIHPKIEPEIGFVLKKELTGPDVTKEDVLAATDYVFPAIEIIDSRYVNFNFTMPDVVADNTSAAGAVYGVNVRQVDQLDLETIGVVLEINGEVQTTGAGAAVLNHPAESVAYLANMLAKDGASVPANTPILTGGITAAVKINAGDFAEVKFGQGLGSVRLFVQ